ncbi:unnamed protein product [Sphenostylis stenocarpa]|uniref:Glycosyl-hydrolase family 116 catalytic region domain-containing protein n=1 Tax=Sphenostylis stenocarpa TaxID=92480 RepID=A0AA87B8X8_9FABA|nr:unnamed protein product [Sphenostylis stenocarpa]
MRLNKNFRRFGPLNASETEINREIAFNSAEKFNIFGSVLRDFARAVLCEDGRKVKFLAEGNWGIRKVYGAAPHDLGTYDPCKWKDLNPKFVLQVYRDFAATSDLQFRIDVWPAVRAAMEYMDQFDRDGDGLIENDGGSSGNSKSIQADQLAGQWYTASSGLPSLFEDSKIKSALRKVYDFNVMKVKGGRMGSVNGMHPNGKVDETCMQSREVWTGVTYGVACWNGRRGLHHCRGDISSRLVLVSDSRGMDNGWTLQVAHVHEAPGHLGYAICNNRPKAILEAPKINIMDRIHLSPVIGGFSRNETDVRKIVTKATCFSNSVFHSAC